LCGQRALNAATPRAVPTAASHGSSYSGRDGLSEGSVPDVTAPSRQLERGADPSMPRHSPRRGQSRRTAASVASRAEGASRAACDGVIPGGAGHRPRTRAAARRARRADRARCVAGDGVVAEGAAQM